MAQREAVTISFVQIENLQNRSIPQVSFDAILEERALKNERALALLRFVMFALVFTLDLLAYLGLIRYTEIRPEGLTLVLDLTMLAPSIILLGIFRYGIYHWSLTIIGITVDYTVISMMLLLDPTISREGELVYWTLMTASVFLFYLNLLRYSFIGTVYSGILSLGMFLGVGFYLNPAARYAGYLSSSLIFVRLQLYLKLWAQEI